ncbi:MAG TPA: 50S ribosomal protein L24 [Tissierellaceae bacterium]
MHVKSGDTVVVIAGKDKGKIGKVLKVFPKENRVIVEGVNMLTKHQKPMGPNKPGGIIKTEGPIHASNVMYYCEKDKTGVRVGRKFLENGKKVRYCKKCGEILDK